VGIEPLFAFFSESDCSVDSILKPLVPAVELSCPKGQQGFSIPDFVPRQRLPCWNAKVHWEDWLLTADQIQGGFLCRPFNCHSVGPQGHWKVVDPVSLHLP
jgi:hypothetical protein